MFFLTTYGILNVSAGIERFLGSPSFRPRFQVHWAWSLLGAVGCVGVMLLINAAATAVAAAFVLGVFLWLERRELRVLVDRSLERDPQAIGTLLLELSREPTHSVILSE